MEVLLYIARGAFIIFHILFSTFALFSLLFSDPIAFLSDLIFLQNGS